MHSGGFTSMNGVLRAGVAQLLQEGPVDLQFNPQLGANAAVLALGRQRDGRILIGGDFTSFNNQPRTRIARLLVNGNLDPEFDPGEGVTGTETPVVLAVTVQPDDKVLLGGFFTHVAGAPRNYLARLEANGQLDSAFNPQISVDPTHSVLVVARQSNDQILVGGQFTEVNGEPREGLVRLNPDGKLDSGFDARIQPPAAVIALAEQADGKILVGGFFFSIAGVPRNGLVRLLSEGRLDPEFRPGEGVNDQINAIAVQGDGRILIGGFFTTYDGVPRGGVARLHPDGRLDRSFDPGTGVTGGPDPGVVTLAVQADGQVLIGGDFTHVDSVPRAGIARLHGSILLPPEPFHLETVGGGLDGSFELTLHGEVGRSYSIQTSPDLISWMHWTNLVSIEAVTPLVDPALMTATQRFYRALTP